MKKPNIILLLSVLILLIAGCNDSEVTQISKEGAIETVINVDHLDETHDVIITTHNVWVKNVLTKKIAYRDTIPTLGVTSQVAKNDEGDTMSVSLKKEYEVYITVK
jgi:hypothetical protein